MEEAFRSSSQERIERVDDPRAAAVIADPAQLRFLSPFLGQPRFAAEVARELEVPLTTLLYRIRKMVSLGLLRLEYTQTRAGSPLKAYRAVADVLFVPFEVTPAETLEALLAQWEGPWLAMFHRGYARALQEAGSSWGIRVWRETDGGVSVTPTLSPERSWDAAAATSPAVLDALVADMRLTPADAKALQQELIALMQRYTGRSGTRTYFLRLMLAPRAEAGSVLR